MCRKFVAEYFHGKMCLLVSRSLFREQCAHVAADTGDPQQPAFFVQDIGDFGKRLPGALLHEKQDIRIKITAACPHDETFEWRESHAGIRAFAFAHSADTGTVPKMGRQELQFPKWFAKKVCSLA